MKEHENRLTQDAIDKQTERWSAELSPAERCLIQNLYALSQAYAQENERSLERIWQRFVQSQEFPALFQERQPEATGGKLLMQEEQAIQAKQFHRETGPSTLSSRFTQQPRRSFGHTLSMGVAAAVVFLIIVSWALLSYSLHTGSHTGQTTLAGSSQKGVSSGKLLCSVSYSAHMPWVVGVGWSVPGVIATANPYLQTFSAQTCTSQPLINLPATLASLVWAPDGKRLLLLHGDVAEVLDASTRQVIASFGSGFAQAVWASNETRIISTDVNILSHTTMSVKVQVWDASTGALIRTALTFDDGVLIGSAWLSPNGAYLALQKSDHRIEFWNIETGKLVSTTSASIAGNSQPVAWSPNGASLAVGIGSANWPATPAEVQIWSTATGQLTASFKDGDTFEGDIGGLAWSPNGRYLAEGSAEIHIWDVAASKLVTTFGKIATKTTSSNGKATIFSRIASMAWAPDSSRLASLTSSLTYPPGPGSGPSRQDTLNVWQLA